MKLLATAILIIFSSLGYGQTPILDKVKVYPNSNTTVPAVIFQSNTNAGLPLVIFFHGSGEAGTTGQALWNAGLPAALKAGFKPPFPCVIIAPQRNSYSAPPEWTQPIIADALARFKIDTNRIYLTGLSAGGWATYGSQLNLTPEFAKKIAAIVPLSAATQDVDKTKFAQYSTPTWAIVGALDISYKEQNEGMVKSINAIKPNLAKIDIRPNVGHGGWTEIYNASWKDANGKSIWDWLSDKNTGTTITPPVVIPPTIPPVTTPTTSPSFAQVDSMIKANQITTKVLPPLSTPNTNTLSIPKATETTDGYAAKELINKANTSENKISELSSSIIQLEARINILEETIQRLKKALN